MDQNKDKSSHQRAAKRGSMVDPTQISFKNIKDLAPSGILDFQFFQKAERDGQIQVNYSEINKIFSNIENSKRYQHSNQDYQPYYYDDSHTAKIKLSDLKHRISILNPSYPANDLTTLFSGRQELSTKEFNELLKDNELLEDFDPMQEALELFTSNNGEIDIEKVSSLMLQLGYGELDKKTKKYQKSVQMQIKIIKYQKKISKKQQTILINKNIQAENHNLIQISCLYLLILVQIQLKFNHMQQ